MVPPQAPSPQPSPACAGEGAECAGHVLHLLRLRDRALQSLQQSHGTAPQLPAGVLPPPVVGEGWGEGAGLAPKLLWQGQRPNLSGRLDVLK